MKEMAKDLVFGLPWYCYAVLVVVAALLITAFILPPVAIIDKSVLYCAALMLGWSWLMFVTANIPTFIEKGAKIRAKWGDKSVEISKGDDKKENGLELND